jgi:6-phosphogluconolactonase (cycloisomerase 2 family)
LLAVGVFLTFAAGAAAAKQTLYVGGVLGSKGVASLNVGAGGALVPTAGSPTGTTSTDGVALTPDGTHLFATNAGTQSIFTYDVNGDGSLSATGGVVVPGPGDPDPVGIAVSPNGKFAYVADSGTEAVRVLSIAPDGSLGLVDTVPLPAADLTSGIAISPDGSQLFASSANAPARIYGFAVGLDGKLTPQTPAFAAAAAGTRALSIRPDGNTLYSAANGSGGIQAFALEEGTLLQLKGSPYATGVEHNGIAVSPQGDFVYAAREGEPKGSLESFAVGQFGTLSPVGAPVAGAAQTDGIAVTPGGQFVFSAGDSSGGVSSFAATAGLLALTSPTPFPSGVELPIFASLAISPNQPPVASFTATQQGQSDVVRFDARGSTDADGAIARYDWTFGDGTSLANGGPAPVHTYPGPGTYAATVTLTDNEGCSTTFVFTGQTASCNGSAVATTQRSVAVAPLADPRPTLRLFGAKRQTLDGTIELRVSCDEPCRVTARAKLQLGGKKLKIRTATRKASSLKRTKLKLSLPGKTLRKSKAGLEAGASARAKVVATAVDSRGQRSTKVLRTIRLTLPR